jgi:type I restriction enzyme S subunit
MISDTTPTNDFKDTEIGPIPADWEVARLEEVTHETGSRNPQDMPDQYFTYVDVSSVSNETFRIENPTAMPGSEAPSRARRVIHANDVIFATIRPYLKRIAYVPGGLDDQVCSTAFCVIRAKKDIVDPHYLYFTVLSTQFIHRVTELQRGSSYPAVSNDDILGQVIPLPPLDEQRKIAHVLNTLQAEIATQDDVIAAAQEAKRSLMARLFTYGPGPEPAPTKEAEIGEVPEHWDVVHLLAIADKPKYGYTQSASSDEVGPKFLRVCLKSHKAPVT